MDLDQFLASVELRRRPDLVGLPVIVGGTGDPSASRTVVTCASYEAREFGVHAGMPLRAAARRCPDAVFLSGDHELYSQVSAQVHEIFHSVTPLVEPIAGHPARAADQLVEPRGGRQRQPAPERQRERDADRRRDHERQHGVLDDLLAVIEKFVAGGRIRLGRAAQRPGPGQRFGEHLAVGGDRDHQFGAESGGLDTPERHQVRPHRIVGDTGPGIGGGHVDGDGAVPRVAVVEEDHRTTSLPPPEDRGHVLGGGGARRRPSRHVRPDDIGRHLGDLAVDELTGAADPGGVALEQELQLVGRGCAVAGDVVKLYCTSRHSRTSPSSAMYVSFLTAGKSAGAQFVAGEV